MLTIFTKLFGKKSDKGVKELLPLVQKINEEYGKLSPLSNDELRDKTRTFKQRIAESLEKVDAEIADLKKQGEAEDLHVHEKVTLRSEEHTSELQSLMRISYAVFCLKTKNK